MPNVSPEPDFQQLVTELLTERSAPGWASFGLELNPEQIQIRDWVHTFAADVIRPAAAEWDEREETPWPIINEAAAIGLYGLESMAGSFGVSVAWLDKDLAPFIASQRLPCTIDRVKGVIETQRPDDKNKQ